MCVPRRVVVNLLTSLAALFLSVHATPAGDCNHNGVEDAADLTPGPMSFRSPDARFLPTASAGYSVRASDLNSDGHPGVIAIEHKFCTRPCPPPSFSIFSSRPDGSLVETEIIGASGFIVDVEPADLDGDRDTDLVVDLNARLAFFLNDGDGRFGEEGGSVSLQDCPRLRAITDVDGDGKVDILTVCSLLRNDGDLTFRPAAQLAQGLWRAADWNGDGKLDLVDVTAERVWVLLNRSDGTFDAPAAHETMLGADSWLLGEGGEPLSDIDGDGDADLVLFLSCWSCEPKPLRVAVFRQSAGGSLEQTGIHDGPVELSGVWPASLLLTAADLTGDGRTDFAAIADLDGTLGVWTVRNRGDGTFESVMNTIPGAHPSSLAAMDLNSDGRADLVTANGFNDWGEGGHYYNGTSDITVLLSRGDGTFAPETYFVGEGPRNVEAADLDRDGDPDLVVGTVHGFTILVNSGDGAFSGETPRLDLGSDPRFVAAGDLDGDSRRDLVAVTAGEVSGVSVLLNRGDRTFLPAQRSDAPGVFGPIALGDMDGDGHLDLLAVGDLDLNGHEVIVFFAGRGDGYFMDPTGGFPLPAGLQFVGETSLAAADFDGDGLDDLAASAPSTSAIWFAIGGADWIEYPTRAGGGALAAADLDRDGDFDLAIAGSRFSQRVGEGRSDVLLLNRGDGTFEEGASFPGEGNGPLITADLDRDGWADLATGSGRLLRNRGDGTFEIAAFHLPPSGSLAVLDFDGDSREDLVLAAPGGAAVILNETPPATSRDTNHNSIPDECEAPFHRGDPNQDGTTDISDGIAILAYLFAGGATPACLDSADANDDGEVDISDGVSLLNFLFLGGPPPEAPGPPPAPCGLDPGAPSSPGDPGCLSFGPC